MTPASVTPASVTGKIVAVTGGTGFLGRYLTLALHARGCRVRLLARRDPLHPQTRHVPLEVVPGDLADAGALGRLASGADLVIHAAGLVKAADPARFFRVNRDGTAAVAAAARRAGSPFVLVSSLAAREPHLSPYAASKRAGEAAAREQAPGCLILRPSAVYGPWDLELLPFFRAASRGVLPMAGPPDGQVALIHAEDAAEGIVALADAAGVDAPYILADGPGHGWPELAAALWSAAGRRGRAIAVPGALLGVLGRLGDWQGRLTGRAAMVTTGKVRELRHPDWSVAPAEAPPEGLWRPRRGLAKGFAETAAWYRKSSLL